ncbi:ATP phosphoribosyltransferase [Alicyclobacillus cycloheptanicus]|uniref:ATP phosphoribosyltransferase n=1 Tax=Alicyclobacillus cycloheptanicus TaxID=1457 RepID=A0ABT9XIA4_9BACL|nr:ATP phosphoribosyltransferase [Alicyclobacillus cycloheptanicus]MDQ0190042.1 ATP phosphoribosyltransferase [Alicyclobacillus cycloheptanicus]WDM00058.1 ATP phosphoribosyltransferase [Alicyclobacillus cycloheptanicus]
MLTVALAKGRTVDDLMPLWRSAGLPAPDDLDDTRALVFEIPHDSFGTLRMLLAKPADVPAYVSLGVADLGVAGKDVLLESGRDVYELLDLGVAKCRLCVAGRPAEQASRPRRVATKYPRLADAYFRRFGQPVEIVGLSGSIELAAVIGLADRIFDLVQSGATLRANGLVVFDEVLDISARLIANRSSFRMKRPMIDIIWNSLDQEVRTRAASQ